VEDGAVIETEAEPAVAPAETPATPAVDPASAN
jgi:hypothetical protein